MRWSDLEKAQGLQRWQDKGFRDPVLGARWRQVFFDFTKELNLRDRDTWYKISLQRLMQMAILRDPAPQTEQEMRAALQESYDALKMELLL